MARRRRHNNTPLEDMLDLIVLLPWQASLVLAPASYFLLHAFASQGFVIDGSIENMTESVMTNLFRMLALFGQFVMPFLFLLGGLVSFIKQDKRKSLLANTSASGELKLLFDMSWHDFELLVGEYFRQQGYQVAENETAGPDGGVDLVIKKGQETFLVQCKQWRSQNVPVQVVRELFGIVAANGATGGIIVSAGNYTADARAFAEGRNLELINGEKLIAIINQNNNQPEAWPQKPVKVPPPPCPQCGKVMIKRVATKGKFAGSGFWGCSRFPKCRGTLPVEEPTA